MNSMNNMNNIILNPLTNVKYKLNSKTGIYLLKQYVLHYQQKGGQISKKQLTKKIKKKCYNPLYGEKKGVTMDIEMGCNNVKKYNKESVYKNAINFALSKGLKPNDKNHAAIINERRKNSINIAETIYNFAKKHINFNEIIKKNKFITVLGPLEDIIGLVIKTHDCKGKNKSCNVYKHFNRDFVDCAIAVGNDLHFEHANIDLPIILINSGNKNVLEGPINMKQLRVTHCEIQWINDLIKETQEDKTDGIHYEWKTKTVNNGKNHIYINLLVNTEM